METLWAVLNSVSASTRTASLAHRTEILDDHMNDSNFKKLCHIGEHCFRGNDDIVRIFIAIVRSVIGRYNWALEHVVESRIAFSRLNDALPHSTTAEWEAEIQQAELERPNNPDAMDIMMSKIKEGASVKQVTAEIMRNDGLSQSRVPDDGTATDWLLTGFNIEETQ
jgi:hypothetical protein